MANEKRLIDANALVPYLRALYKFFGSSPCTEADKATQRGIKRCIGEIKKMPTVDAVEVVHSKWEYWCGGLLRCPVCGYEYCDYVECVNYCGNCGTKMNGEEV